MTTAPVIAILSIRFIIESYWGKKHSPETKDSMSKFSRTMFMELCKHACFLLLLLFLSSCGQVSPPATETSTIPPFAWTAVALTQTALLTPDVLSTQTPSPEPTQSPFPIFTPNAIQVERWREYQSALAKKFVSKFPVEIVLCEWDILGKAEQELYVWAVCIAPGYEAMRPAAIYLRADGSIQNVDAPIYGSNWDSEINRMFPSVVQKKFNLYGGNSIFNGRLKEMRDHIEYRRQYPEKPPLVVLSAYSTP